MLSVFKSIGNYSKYAIEMFISIGQIECLLMPRLSEEFKWGLVVSSFNFDIFVGVWSHLMPNLHVGWNQRLQAEANIQILSHRQHTA